LGRAVEELAREALDLDRVHRVLRAPPEEVPVLAHQEVNDGRLEPQVRMPDAEGRVVEERGFGAEVRLPGADGQGRAQEVHLERAARREPLGRWRLEPDTEARVANAELHARVRAGVGRRRCHPVERVRLPRDLAVTGGVVEALGAVPDRVHFGEAVERRGELGDREREVGTLDGA
jgi:hypothetical protein